MASILWRMGRGAKRLGLTDSAAMKDPVLVEFLAAAAAPPARRIASICTGDRGACLGWGSPPSCTLQRDVHDAAGRPVAIQCATCGGTRRAVRAHLRPSLQGRNQYETGGLSRYRPGAGGADRIGDGHGSLSIRPCRLSFAHARSAPILSGDRRRGRPECRCRCASGCRR